MSKTPSEYEMRFFSMVSRFPRIAHCWDQEECVLIQERFEHELQVMSSVEKAIARFLVGAWFKENRYDFDLFDDLFRMDSSAKRLVIEWIEEQRYS